MKRLLTVCSPLCFALILFTSMPVQAGVLSSVKDWLTAEMAAIILSSVAALAAGAIGLMYSKAIRTFRETGEFLTALGMALDDNHISREELAVIIREGREIFSIWR